MRTFLGIAIIPLICLGVIILTTLMAILILRRRTQMINQQVQERLGDVESGTTGNTRWARGDLKSAPKPKKTEPKMIACPGCGGENPAGSKSCAYCGRAL
jgi:hypothetical protein